MAKRFRGRVEALVAVLCDRPLRVRFGSAGEGHFYPSGRVALPIIAGADGEGGPAAGAGDEAAKGAAEKEAPAKAAEATKPAEANPDEEILKGAENRDAVKRALDAERAAAKDAKAEADSLRKKVKEYEDRDKSEQEKAEQRASDAEKKAEGAERKLLRLEVALDKKLPSALAARLAGSTKTELEADADELLKLVKKEDTVDFDGGPRKTSKNPEDMNSRIRSMAGRG